MSRAEEYFTLFCNVCVCKCVCVCERERESVREREEKRERERESENVQVSVRKRMRVLQDQNLILYFQVKHNFFCFNMKMIQYHLKLHPWKA